MWGIGERLWGNRPITRASFQRPHGFIVVEGPPRRIGGGGRVLYLVMHANIDTRRAGYLVARALGARRFEYSGLKDACAIVYQYYTFATRKLAKLAIAGGSIRAWPIGKSTPLRPGTHSGNTFILTMEVGDEDRFCDAFKDMSWVPGYYGPQRFGVERPNTHYMGFLIIKSDFGRLAREYRYRYPTEKRQGIPGDYEREFLSKIRMEKTPWVSHDRWASSFAIQALQSYLFNRSLSRVVSDPLRYAEHWITMECMGMEYRVPAVRLPAPGLGRRSRWARIVWEVAEEEGLTWLLKDRRFNLKKSFRPITYPLCGKARCRPTRRGVMVSMGLPAGAYATIAVWQVADVDWESLECRICKETTKL